MTDAERRIARLVIARGQVSKAQIESTLDYSHPTVVNAVGTLVAEGVLRESGEFDSTGGRIATGNVRHFSRFENLEVMAW